MSANMQGVYFYGDYCSGQLWSLRPSNPRTWVSTLIADTPYTISSFGEDEAGELYLVDYSGGSIMRIVGVEEATPAPSVTPSAITGDLSNDGAVDILDIQLCVNVIMGSEDEPGILGRSDANADGIVNIQDIQTIVNLILMS
jgi:Dockerin type I domain